MIVLVEVFRDGQWQEANPQIGEMVRSTYSSGHVVEAAYMPSSEVPDALYPITLTQVDGAHSVNESLTRISATQGATIVLSGTVPIPDKAFITPIESINIATGGRTTLYKETQVINGVFQIELTLPAGKYRVTQELMNSELPKPFFSLEPIDIYITI
ncbi:hypothetical protein VroAM7_44870 [Vibrio rotiferianus]|uniref:DUF4198 domain-containing protein n=1 Tax=Vibrio rotiferianus TaxID=190895 RepID=A0A510IDF4_9VIBR|nr:hypothetical protein [Vibrio rotiferianus]BBL91834.1 hypothetical protein VroAM7_44870 [Vibrio rotiferianus]